MTKLIIKSVVFGFVISLVFLGVVYLNLVFAFAEFLRPILIPGFDLLRPLWKDTSGSYPWILGIILNVLIYAFLFLSISLIRKQAVSAKVRFWAILFVVTTFLAITGMLTNLCYFLISPNKSWIFRIGP